MVFESGKVTEIRFFEKSAAVRIKVKNPYPGADGPNYYFVRCVCFGPVIDIVKKYGDKGKFASVTGWFLPGKDGNPRLMETQDGKKYATYDVRVAKIIFSDTGG